MGHQGRGEETPRPTQDHKAGAQQHGLPIHGGDRIPDNIGQNGKKANGVARDNIDEVKVEVTTVLQSYDPRTEVTEQKITSLNDWAGDVANRADPDTLFADLEEKDRRIKE